MRVLGDKVFLRITEDNKEGIFSKIFKNWRKITYKPAIVTDMKVEKF